MVRAIEGTARTGDAPRTDPPVADMARAVLTAVEQHLGTVRMAARLVLDDADGAVWRKDYLLVTRAYVAVLGLTVDD